MCKERNSALIVGDRLTPVVIGWLDEKGAPCFCAFSLGMWKVGSERTTWDGPALKGLIAVLLGGERQCVLFWAKLPCVSWKNFLLEPSAPWHVRITGIMWSVLLHPSDKLDCVKHTWLWAKFKWASVFQALRSRCRIPVVKLLWSSGSDSRDVNMACVCLWCLQPKIGICAGFLEVIHSQRWHHLT